MNLILLFSLLATDPCSSQDHRAFDFWIGEWRVESEGELAGFNRIEKIHGGCGLSESYRTEDGSYTGRSVNAFDQPRGKWHQTWVDSSGTVLLLDGNIRDGSMVLQGSGPGKGGIVAEHRVSWTANDDGTIRQLWQVRADQDTPWTTLFDGIYRRQEE